jgi:hypothetical protein
MKTCSDSVYGHSEPGIALIKKYSQKLNDIDRMIADIDDMKGWRLDDPHAFAG